MRPRIIELLYFAFLSLKLRVIHGAAIDARRSTRLESGDGKPGMLELFSEVSRRRFTSAAA